MVRLDTPPNWFVNIFTLGILRALWIAESNRRLKQGGAGFAFAWFLLPFAQYGLAKRMTLALAQVGSSHKVSPLACFWLAGWPFIGAHRRLKRGTQAYNDALGVMGQQALGHQASGQQPFGQQASGSHALQTAPVSEQASPPLQAQ